MRFKVGEMVLKYHQTRRMEGEVMSIEDNRYIIFFQSERSKWQELVKDKELMSYDGVYRYAIKKAGKEEKTSE